MTFLRRFWPSRQRSEPTRAVVLPPLANPNALFVAWARAVPDQMTLIGPPGYAVWHDETWSSA